MKLFDAHCHLQDSRILDVGKALEGATRAGVVMLACCGTSETDWEKVSHLARKYDQILPAFGLHPWYLGQRSPEWLDILRTYLEEVPSTVGEVGLDFALEEVDRQDQESVFLAQLELARALDRPVTIHCRRAWGRLQELLTDFGPLPQGFLIHSYSGSTELIEPLARLGARFSFSGTVTRSRNKRAHRNCREVPPDRLLIETDAPDMMPEPAQGDVNEPANLVHVLHEVAVLRFEQDDEMARITWGNACRFFGREEG